MDMSGHEHRLSLFFFELSKLLAPEQFDTISEGHLTLSVNVSIVILAVKQPALSPVQDVQE